ncbi:T9SS type A sorting domain-containing protein [bacterium]|nr:T9SS type A sorting domain-containing protein [bacterium]
MSTLKLISRISALTIVGVLFLGMQMNAQATFTWTGTVNNEWDNAGNWTCDSLGGQWPGNNVTDIAVLDASAARIPQTPSAGVTITELQVTGGVQPVQKLSLWGDLTVTGAITVGDGLTPAPFQILDLGGLLIVGQHCAMFVDEDANVTGTAGIEMHGTLSMPACETTNTTYIGSGVVTDIQNGNFMAGPVCFLGDIDISAVPVRLGYNNLYLGIDADLIGAATSPSNGSNDPGAFYCVNGDYISTPAQGRVCKEFTSTNVGSTWDFPIGTVTGASTTEGITILRLGLCPGQAWPISTPSAFPFSYLSVRAVFNHNSQHPEANVAATMWYYWSVKGAGIPNGPYEPGLMGQIAFHSKYRSNDPRIYSAIYRPNVEDSPSSGYWDISGSFDGYKIASTWFVNFGPYPDVNAPAPQSLYTNPNAACMPGYGDLSVGQGTGVPPVELTSFSARYYDGNVNLKWQTATELNNHGFYVERSLDGESWEDIGFVDGAGTSNVPLDYNYTDILDRGLLEVPQIAYRLRQEDRDGTIDYSGIVYAFTGAQADRVELYEAYPNPFNPSTKLSFSLQEAAHASLKVYNTFGQVVATVVDGEFDAGFHTVEFEGSALPSGVYIAVLEAAGTVQQQKLVLNK